MAGVHLGHTVEFQKIKKSQEALMCAVQDNLVTLSIALSSKELITFENGEYLRNESISQSKRAAKLVTLVVNKVLQDSQNYRIFVNILKEKGAVYKEVIRQLELTNSFSDVCTSIATEADHSELSKHSRRDEVLLVDKTGAAGELCTCCICIQTFGCPQALPVSQLDRSLEASTSDKRGDHFLLTRLRDETSRQIFEFYKLLDRLCRSMKQRKIPLDDLTSTLLMQLPAFTTGKTSPCGQQVSAFKEYKPQLQSATTYTDVFAIIKENCSFFKFEIVKYLIEEYGNDVDTANLRQYAESFKQYAKCRAIDCSECTYQGTNKPCLVFKLDSVFDDYKLEQIEDFHWEVCKTLQISQYVLNLCCIKKGCIMITYQIPDFVRKVVFPLTPKQESHFEHLGVIGITCGEYEFKNTDGSGSKIQLEYCTELKKHNDVEYSEYLCVQFNDLNNKSEVKSITKLKALQRWKKFWVVLRIAPSHTTSDRTPDNLVGTILYYKKEEDWKRNHKSLVQGSLTKNIIVTAGCATPSPPKKLTKYCHILQLKERSFQFYLAFDSEDNLLKWQEALLSLTEYHYVELVRCPENPTLEGQYLVQVCPSSCKVLSLELKFKWEWQLKHILRIHWHKKNLKLEVETVGNSETGKDCLSFIGRDAESLFHAIHHMISLHSPASSASPTSPGLDSEDDWKSTSSYDSHYIDNMRTLHGRCNSSVSQVSLSPPPISNEYVHKQLNPVTRNKVSEYQFQHPRTKDYSDEYMYASPQTAIKCNTDSIGL